MKVNQWVPAAHKGDAIGDSARRVRDLLRSMGHQSDVFALTIDDNLRHDVRSFTESGATRGDLTIFQSRARHGRPGIQTVVKDGHEIKIRRFLLGEIEITLMSEGLPWPELDRIQEGFFP